MSHRRTFRLASAMALSCVMAVACGEDEFAFLEEQERQAEAERREAARRARGPEDDAAEPATTVVVPPPRTAASSDAGPAPVDPAAFAGMRPLDAVPDPANTLAAVDVRDQSGGVVGVVSAVEPLPGGGIEELVVALDDGKTLSVTPPFARFDDSTQSVRLVVSVDELAPYRP